MNRDVLKTVAKWVWVLSILVFVGFYAYRHYVAIVDAVAMLGWHSVGAALLLIMSAKLCLVINMKVAGARFAIRMSWWECFRIYNQTQLGKYIPGSIWQFVGRIAILRGRGVANATIRDALLAEHLWVVLVASGFGVLLIGVAGGQYLGTWVEHLEMGRWVLPILALVGLVGALLVALVARTRDLHIAVVGGWLVSLLPPLTAVLTLLAAWLLLGTSLWVTLNPYLSVMPSLAYIVGAYCVAYVAGFFVPFAPAGLGIREALLVLALSPLVSHEIAVSLAGINRVVYFVAELAFAALSVSGSTPKRNGI